MHDFPKILGLVIFFSMGCFGSSTMKESCSSDDDCGKKNRPICMDGECRRAFSDLNETSKKDSPIDKLGENLTSCEENKQACQSNRNGKTLCLNERCVEEVHIAECTDDGNECASNTDMNVVCIDNICTIPTENQTECTEGGNECMANTNGKTFCDALKCEVPFVNTRICAENTECENNRNNKISCVDAMCHLSLVGVESCTREGNECALNTNGNIRCIEDVCVRGGNPNVRVIWEKDPAHRATISVTADDAKLFFDTKKRRSVLADYGETLSPNSIGEYYDSDNKNYAHFNLENLEPSTKYYFVIKSKTGISREFYFTTAPVDDRTFKILYGGDSRGDTRGGEPAARQEVNRMIREQVETDPEFLVFIHGGDFNKSGNHWGEWQSWLDDYELCVAKDGKILPLIPTRGNHEHGILFNEAFATPGKDRNRNYFSTKLGKLLWITLDSEYSLLGKQLDFLKEELKSVKDFRWAVASYHTPAYPAYKSPGKALGAWVPLFEKYNIDLVAESDGHTLKRTVKIRNGKKSEDGIIYFGEGGLGVTLRTPRKGRWYFESPGMVAKAHHIQILSVSKTGLKYEAMTLENKAVEDTFTIQPRTR